jgi:phage tail-like protein
MTEVRGKPVEIYDKMRFVLEIDGIIYGGFKTCSPIADKSGVLKHWEGGSKLAKKKLGNIDYDPLTLERGLSDNTELYDWRKGTKDGTLKGKDKRKTVRLIVQDEDQEDRIAYKFYECLNAELHAGPWDNEAQEMVLEKLVLEFEDYDRENLT